MLEFTRFWSVHLLNFFTAASLSKLDGAEVLTFAVGAEVLTSDFRLERTWESAQTRECAEPEWVFGWCTQAEAESETDDLCTAVSLQQLSSRRHEKRKKMVDQVFFTLISMRQFSRSLPALRSPHLIWSHLYLCPLRASSNSHNFLSETQNIKPDWMEW